MGLAKPFIYTSKALVGSEPVNSDQITAFSKVDQPSTNGDGTAGPTDFLIVFNLGEQGVNIGTTKWRYENESDRDDDYDGILSTIGTDVAAVS